MTEQTIGLHVPHCNAGCHKLSHYLTNEDYPHEHLTVMSLHCDACQNTPVSAPSGPSAGLEGQDATQETQAATEAAQRRRERYEDLAVRLLELNDFRAHDRAVAARIGSAYRSLADAEHHQRLAEIDAVAQTEKDATIAELRAEVDARPYVSRVYFTREKVRAEAAEARVAELEATVAKVRELADAPPGDCEGAPCIWPYDLRAVLDAPKDTTAP